MVIAQAGGPRDVGDDEVLQPIDVTRVRGDQRVADAVRVSHRQGDHGESLCGAGDSVLDHRIYHGLDLHLRGLHRAVPGHPRYATPVDVDEPRCAAGIHRRDRRKLVADLLQRMGRQRVVLGAQSGKRGNG